MIRGVARVGEHVNFEACMDIMDLLYEKEETSILFSSPILLAASILARSSHFLDLRNIDLVVFKLVCLFSFLRVLNFLQVASYVITVPKQRWEFPVLPWGKCPV